MMKTGKLPINLTDLLRQRTVEGERIKYKAGYRLTTLGQRWLEAHPSA